MSSTLDWPEEFDRTPPGERTPYPHGFRVSRREAIENIIDEVEKMGDLRGFRIETGAEHRNDEPNVPRADATYDDPGVVVYWNRGGEAFAAPCDRWDTLRDNAQAIYHYIQAKRGIERWGVDTVASEFSTQRLEKVAVDE